VSRRELSGGLYGTLWGACSAAVFVAMRAHMLPAPFEVALLLALGMFVADLPFLVAVGLEALLGRPSPSRAEIVGVTIACGTALGLAVSRLRR
jgi:hypothetical protein